MKEKKQESKQLKKDSTKFDSSGNQGFLQMVFVLLLYYYYKMNVLKSFKSFVEIFDELIFCKW